MDLADESVLSAVSDRCYRRSADGEPQQLPFPVRIIEPDSEHGRPVLSMSAGRQDPVRPLGAIGEGLGSAREGMANLGGTDTPRQ